MDDDIKQFSYDTLAVSQELHVRPEILTKLLKSFSNTLSQKIAQLDDFMLKNDVIQIRAIMHEVKGTSGNLRLKQVYEAADAMHVSVKAGDPAEKITELFGVFRKEAFLFIDYFKNC
ncbi:MAG: Hpt domain-containing protein [Candidatus Omnitrophota bacterium]